MIMRMIITVIILILKKSKKVNKFRIMIKTIIKQLISMINKIIIIPFMSTLKPKLVNKKSQKIIMLF